MGEMGLLFQDSLVMDSHNSPPDFKLATSAASRGRGHSFASESSYNSRGPGTQNVVYQGLGSSTPIAMLETAGHHPVSNNPPRNGLIKRYLEMWDYKGGAKFRGFETNDRTLVVFFDHDVVERELKPGLMALIELVSTDCLACEQLMVCLERGDMANTSLMRDLRWVGFEPATLGRWTRGTEMTSDFWMFLGIDV